MNGLFKLMMMVMVMMMMMMVMVVMVMMVTMIKIYDRSGVHSNIGHVQTDRK